MSLHVLPDLANFPSAPLFVQRSWDFLTDAEISDFTWSASGGSAPTAVNDEAFGSVSIASGTADNNYVLAQTKREIIRLNGLGKTHEFLFRGRVSEVTQADYGFGIGIRDTLWLGDTDGLSHGVWLRKADGSTGWDLVVANGAAAFPGDYTQQNSIWTALDTASHDYAIRIITDPTTLGKGTVTAFVDGNQVAALQVNNLPHTEELTLMFGVRNGDAAGTNKTLTAGFVGFRSQR